MAITTYVKTYMSLFVGRRDDYAIQTQSGRYRRAKEPLTEVAVFDHLLGTHTYGTYIMDPAGRCRFAVIDADTDDGLDRLWQIQEQLVADRIISYVERSRRGGHLWIFFKELAPASQVHAWLLRYCPSDMEFYPKQDEGKGYGSLIRLPLGIHRKSGQRYPFVERRAAGVLVPLTLTDEQRSTWFASIQRMDVPQVKQAPSPPTGSSAPTPTSFSSLPQAPSLTGEITTIRQWNASQDPYQVISQHITLTPGRDPGTGVGKCPFGEHHTGGEDRQSSFKVYQPGASGGYCWYCYTWQKGGSLFDFLKYYYHLEPQELWRHIQNEDVAGLE